MPNFWVEKIEKKFLCQENCMRMKKMTEKLETETYIGKTIILKNAPLFSTLPYENGKTITLDIHP